MQKFINKWQQKLLPKIGPPEIKPSKLPSKDQQLLAYGPLIVKLAWGKSWLNSSRRRSRSSNWFHFITGTQHSDDFIFCKLYPSISVELSHVTISYGPWSLKADIAPLFPHSARSLYSRYSVSVSLAATSLTLDICLLYQKFKIGKFHWKSKWKFRNIFIL